MIYSCCCDINIDGHPVMNHIDLTKFWGEFHFFQQQILKVICDGVIAIGGSACGGWIITNINGRKNVFVLAEEKLVKEYMIICWKTLILEKKYLRNFLLMLRTSWYSDFAPFWRSEASNYITFYKFCFCSSIVLIKSELRIHKKKSWQNHCPQSSILEWQLTVTLAIRR